MSNPLMRVMLNNTICKASIRASTQKEATASSNLREEQEKLLKKILEKQKNQAADRGIRLMTLEELKKDYQRNDTVTEKKEETTAGKNLVSLASIGKLSREVK